MATLPPSSVARLAGVHPDLCRVIKRAANDSSLMFVVTEGVRSTDRQRQLLKAGATRTMNSRHIPTRDGFGHAVDLAVLIDGHIRWDWPLYYKLSAIVKAAAKAENVPIEWGGDWWTFKDGPHFQLPFNRYP